MKILLCTLSVFQLNQLVFSKLGGKKKRNEIINWMQRYMSMYIEHRYMYHSTRFNKQLSKFNTDVGIIIYKSKDKMYIYFRVQKS